MRQWEGQVHNNQLEPDREVHCAADRLICPSALVLNLMWQGVKERSFCVRPNFPFTTADDLPQSSATCSTVRWLTALAGYLETSETRLGTSRIWQHKTCVPSNAEPSSSTSLQLMFTDVLQLSISFHQSLKESNKAVISAQWSTVLHRHHRAWRSTGEHYREGYVLLRSIF